MSPSSSEGPRCPVCSKPRAERFKPFCSKRCAEIDLGRWFKGSYAVPGGESDEGDGAPGPEPDEGER